MPEILAVLVHRLPEVNFNLVKQLSAPEPEARNTSYSRIMRMRTIIHILVETMRHLQGSMRGKRRKKGMSRRRRMEVIRILMEKMEKKRKVDMTGQARRKVMISS